MISRIFKALNRYSLALENLGIYTTLQIIWHRVFKMQPEIEVHSKAKKFGEFFWSSKNDWVISHFYTPQIEVYSPKGEINIGTVVDLGANIGTESIRFSLLYPKARIYSVEANNVNYERLKKNTVKFTNITPIMSAIWSSVTKLKLVSDTSDSQAWHVIETNDSDYDMEGTIFSNILTSYDINFIDILKVDIEGAERELFGETADGWISKVNCIIMEIPDIDAPGTTQLIYRLFEKNSLQMNTYVNGENIVFVRNHLDWRVRFIERY